ncbi:ataxin-10 isoform X2 [Tachypleus tridentatus]|uniref:ataxin-10 isoform X2 n=1 Tax=Tachypleus tridentatus TaxID=6853 RepID=UPI003FD46693
MAESLGKELSDLKNLFEKLNYIQKTQFLNDCSISNQVKEYLHKLFNLLKNDDARRSMSEAHFKVLDTTSRYLLDVTTVQHQSPEESLNLDISADLFRCLRNACVQNSVNQDMILRNLSSSVHLVHILVEKYLSREDFVNSELLTNVKCGLQFIGNLVTGNTKTQDYCWNIFFDEHHLFNGLLRNQDRKVSEISSMVLFNCLNFSRIKQLTDTQDGIEITDALITHVAEGLCEWSLFIVKNLVQNEGFFPRCYDSISMRNRLVLLDLVTEELTNKKESESEQFNVPSSAVTLWKEKFKNVAMNMLQTCTNSTQLDLEPLEVEKILNVLCLISVLPALNDDLKQDYELIESLVDTLKSIHLLGKTGTNYFTPIQSLHEINNCSLSIQTHPAYGFKKNLIRLIGNVCYECQKNQDMKCSDILQWSVFALRNLLNKNKENQKLVANMSAAGVPVRSDILTELGHIMKPIT